MTVKEVAKKMNKSESFVRQGLINKDLPFGTAVQTVEPGKKYPRGLWSYHIVEEAFYHYMKFGNVPVQIIGGVENEK